MNMNRYFICIGNPRLHSCLSKNIFRVFDMPFRKQTYFESFIDLFVNIYSIWVNIGQYWFSQNIFDINSYKSKIKKRSTTKKLRNGLESLRDAKINKKLETLKKKPGFLSTGRGVLYHTWSISTSRYQKATFLKNQPSSLGCYF